MKKQKVYWGIVILIVIIIAIGAYVFSRQEAKAPTEPINQNMAGSNIPANMSISNELGG